MKPPELHNPSLLAPKNTGGITAGKGFNFQDAFIVSRIPEWLANPDFSSLLKEGLDDVDLKFIVSGEQRTDIYQVKNHLVDPPECCKIIEAFFEKDHMVPNAKFFLACSGLHEKVKSLRQAVERLREAYPTYKLDDSIRMGTEQDIQTRANAIGLKNIPVDFLRKKVFFDTDLGDMKSDERLREQFIGSVMSRIPQWASADVLSITAAYLNIFILINRKIGVSLSRKELEETIQQAIRSSPQRINREGVRVRLFHWEDPAFDLSEQWDVLLNWSQHFDRNSRKVPAPSVWRDHLIPALEEAQKRIRSSTDSRLIRFRPSACLSAGLALGCSFSEVKGYTFEIQQGPDIWRSDLQISTERPLVLASEVSLDESAKDLCVEISQQADVTAKVDHFTLTHSKIFRAKIILRPDLGIGTRMDGQTALACAYQAKQAIRQAVNKYQCTTVHLFYAGPLGLAIFLGRLFNAMHADIQCYEEQNEGGYTPSCLLHTQ